MLIPNAGLTNVQCEIVCLGSTLEKKIQSDPSCSMMLMLCCIIFINYFEMFGVLAFLNEIQLSKKSVPPVFHNIC